MGRGRAKAKQTKVARELKYWSPETDLRALERELHGSQYKDPDRQFGANHDGDEEGEAWASGDR